MRGRTLNHALRNTFRYYLSTFPRPVGRSTGSGMCFRPSLQARLAGRLGQTAFLEAAGPEPCITEYLSVGFEHCFHPCRDTQIQPLGSFSVTSGSVFVWWPLGHPGTSCGVDFMPHGPHVHHSSLRNTFCNDLEPLQCIAVGGYLGQEKMIHTLM